MRKHFLPYLTIPCLALFVATSGVQAKKNDDDNRGKNKKDRKEQHEDRKDDRRDDRNDRNDDLRDYGRDDRIDYRNDRRFDYRDSRRDVSYRSRYPRHVVVYEGRSYGYNYYDMQIVLLRAGYYNGSIDGIWGPASRRALIRYQSDQGWRRDGVVDGRFVVNFGIGY